MHPLRHTLSAPCAPVLGLVSFPPPLYVHCFSPFSLVYPDHLGLVKVCVYCIQYFSFLFSFVMPSFCFFCLASWFVFSNNFYMTMLYAFVSIASRDYFLKHWYNSIIWGFFHYDVYNTPLLFRAQVLSHYFLCYIFIGMMYNVSLVEAGSAGMLLFYIRIFRSQST